MEDREEPTDEGGEPEHIQVHMPEVDVLAARAELLHLPHDESMATQTQTQVREEPPYIRINPVTGHAMNVDEDTAENIRRALGSDHADPPDEQQHTSIPHWQFQSLERPVDNRSIHRHNHHPGARKAEAEAGEVTEEVEEEEMGEADYLLQQDQACSHHMDELLTLNS
jgi:hypothetical protein